MDEPNDLVELMRARVEKRLADLDLTAITAATKAGIPRDTIRNLFRTGSLPRADTLAKIAEALETTVAYLMGETDYPLNDYSDEDRMSAARAAIESAKPVPVIGLAEWGRFEAPRHTHDPIDLLHINVPGFEEAPLSALVVTDDHADIYFDEGDYAVFAWVTGGVGIRNGDLVVVMHRREVDGEAKVEFTIREDYYGVRRGPTGHRYMTSGLLSVAVDKEKFPDWSGWDGSRSTVFPPEPPDRGWTTAESAAGEGATPETIAETMAALAEGRGDEEGEPITDFLQVIGVVVAKVAFIIRPSGGPTMYHRTDLTPQEELERLEREGATSPPHQG